MNGCRTAKTCWSCMPRNTLMGESTTASTLHLSFADVFLLLRPHSVPPSPSSLHPYIPPSLPPSLPACLPASLPPCLPACLPPCPVVPRQSPTQRTFASCREPEHTRCIVWSQVVPQSVRPQHKKRLLGGANAAPNIWVANNLLLDVGIADGPRHAQHTIYSVAALVVLHKASGLAARKLTRYHARSTRGSGVAMIVGREQRTLLTDKGAVHTSAVQHASTS
jgi:hypothetical protein